MHHIFTDVSLLPHTKTHRDRPLKDTETNAFGNVFVRRAIYILCAASLDGTESGDDEAEERAPQVQAGEIQSECRQRKLLRQLRSAQKHTHTHLRPSAVLSTTIIPEVDNK